MSLRISEGCEPVAGYTVTRFLGEGGFGQVWEAEAPGRVRVAIKVIRLQTACSAAELRALEVIRDIRHPNLLDVQFWREVDGALLIAMPLCDQSLMDRMNECRARGLSGIPPHELIGYMEELAKAVDFLNEPRHLAPDGTRIGIQHRDIKPNNIFLVGGSVRLADFGLAKFVEGASAHHTGAMTPSYAAPEVMHNRVALQSDQYSLAVTYCYLRTGRLPITGDSVALMIDNLLYGEPDLSTIPGDETAGLRRALAKEPGDRWPNCHEFVSALKRACREPAGVVPHTDTPFAALGAATEPDREATTSPIPESFDTFPARPGGPASPDLDPYRTTVRSETEAPPGPAVPTTATSRWRGDGGADKPEGPRLHKWLAAGSGLAALVVVVVSLLVWRHRREAAPKGIGPERTKAHATGGGGPGGGSKPTTQVDLARRAVPGSPAMALDATGTRPNPRRRAVRFQPPGVRVTVDGEQRPPDDHGRLLLDFPGGASVELVARAPGFRADRRTVRSGDLDGPEITIALRAFHTEREVLTAVRDHLRSTPEPDRAYQRYFSFVNLADSPATGDEDLRLYRAALSKLVNSLSWSSRAVLPRAAGGDGLVLGLDLRSPGWDKELWEAVLKEYPYGLKHDDDADPLHDLDKEVRSLAEEDLPCVRADWFVATASRPPLYHEILRLPPTVTGLEELIKADPSAAFREGTLARAGYTRSRVGPQHQVAERSEAGGAGYWRTYDFRPGRPRGDVFRFPLGPKFEGNPFSEHAFAPDCGMILFPLPNGLQGYMLVGPRGERLDAAPADVATDPSRTAGDETLVNGLSCLACHKSGVFPLRDEVRVAPRVTGLALAKVKALFPPPAALDELIARDERRFREALGRVVAPFVTPEGGPTPSLSDLPESIGSLARRYAGDLTLDDVAAELGLDDGAAVLAKVRQVPRLRKAGLEPLLSGKPVSRAVWREVFDQAAIELERGTPHRSF